jgi:hypothetical protein
VTLTPVQCVLDELDARWGVGGTPGLAQPLGTFAAVIQSVGAAAWKRLPVLQKVVRFGLWLTEVVQQLCDSTLSDRWRFRRAWEVLPARLLGCAPTEASVLAAAQFLDVDRRRIDVIGAQFQGATPPARSSMSRELADIIERYTSPSQAPGQWAYLVESVRVAVNYLPSIECLQSPKRSPQRPTEAPDAETAAVCFCFAVYDAMCPGLAGSLDERSVRDAISLWKAMHPPTSRRLRVVTPRATGSERFWTLVREMTKSPHAQDTLRRRWPKVRASVAVDVAPFILELFERKGSASVPRNGSTHFRFAPRAREDAGWVEYLLRAVWRALPPQHSPPGPPPTASSEWAPPLNEEFLAAADAMLPPIPRGLRGPPPMTNRDALPWIIHKFRRDLGWKQIPSGSKYQRRFEAWRLARAALCQLAKVHCVLPSCAAERMSRG